MTYVTSNIHGDYDSFKRLLEVISFKESDIMYILGDIVDYGEKSMELIEDISMRYNIYSIVGEHEIIFAGQDEVIRIHHSAFSREVFAKGALSAALYLASCEAGLYSMEDMLK